MYEENKIGEATLYYLYMMADGKVSQEEVTLFDTICKEMELNSESKQAVIQKSKEMAEGSSDLLNIIIENKIDDQAVIQGFGAIFSTMRDASSRGRIIWNLVNLGYADKVYSDEEKVIVKYLVDKWSVNADILQEFVDVADTMLALTKQKQWVSATYKGEKREKKEEQISSQITELLQDVKLTISEITM